MLKLSPSFLSLLGAVLLLSSLGLVPDHTESTLSQSAPSSSFAGMSAEAEGSVPITLSPLEIEGLQCTNPDAQALSSPNAPTMAMPAPQQSEGNGYCRRDEDLVNPADVGCKCSRCKNGKPGAPEDLKCSKHCRKDLCKCKPECVS